MCYGHVWIKSSIDNKYRANGEWRVGDNLTREFSNNKKYDFILHLNIFTYTHQNNQGLSMSDDLMYSWMGVTRYGCKL